MLGGTHLFRCYFALQLRIHEYVFVNPFIFMPYAFSLLFPATVFRAASSFQIMFKVKRLNLKRVVCHLRHSFVSYCSVVVVQSPNLYAFVQQL